VVASQDIFINKRSACIIPLHYASVTHGRRGDEGGLGKEPRYLYREVSAYVKETSDSTNLRV